MELGVFAIDTKIPLFFKKVENEYISFRDFKDTSKVLCIFISLFHDMKIY